VAVLGYNEAMFSSRWYSCPWNKTKIVRTRFKINRAISTEEELCEFKLRRRVAALC
jgi:hypothetical protein